MLESIISVSRVIATLAGCMTPEQMREAASRLRALPAADASDRDFYATHADALEEYAEGVEAKMSDSSFR